MTQAATKVPTLTLGWRMRMALEGADVKVQTMADELGVTRATVSRWMHDQGSEPRLAFVKQWALRTGVPFTWLATGEAPAGPHDGGSDVASLPTSRIVRPGGAVLRLRRPEAA